MADVNFSPSAAQAIQRVYDDPAQSRTADRLEALLALLAQDPGDRSLRRRRTDLPVKLWIVPVPGSEFVFMWEPGADGQPYVRWAGEF